MTTALLAFALALAAAGQRVLVVDPATSVVRFHLDHKLHKTDGSSAAIEGKAVIAEDGKVLAMIRIPVASFETGDGNRDSHMRQALEASRFPHVVLKAVTSVTVPVGYGKALDAKLRGELELHGVRRTMEIPAQVSFDREGRAAVKASFPLSLEAHGIERPSLLFVKVDDQLLVDVELTLRVAPP